MSVMLKITFCPTCESNNIKKVRRNWTGQVKGRTYMVPNLEYYECPDCGEKVYDREAMRKIEERSPAFSSKPMKKVA